MCKSASAVMLGGERSNENEAPGRADFLSLLMSKCSMQGGSPHDTANCREHPQSETVTKINTLSQSDSFKNTAFILSHVNIL